MWRSLLLAGLILGLGSPLSASDAGQLAEVRRQHLEAIGGLTRLQGLRTIYLRGTLIADGSQAGEIQVLKKRPDRVRALISRPDGSRLVQGFDGTTAWMSYEDAQGLRVTPMGRAAADSFIHSAPIDSPLVRPEARGATLSYGGRERIDGGVEAHRVEARFPDGTRTVYFLDAKTHIERKYVTYRPTADGGTWVTESSPSDYRMVDGVLVAFRLVERSEDGRRVELTVEEVNSNVGALDDLFAMPASGGSE